MRGRSERVPFHGPDCICNDLLLHEADARAASDGYIPGVSRFEAGGNPEQRGLPHSVRPDEPDTIAVREAEGDVAEHEPLAKALRDCLHRKDGHGILGTQRRTRSRYAT